MGGMGSGPYGAGVKKSRETVGMYRFWSVSQIKNHLHEGKKFRLEWEKNLIKCHVKGDEIYLSGVLNGEKVSRIVVISWTNCTYGGKRPWFLCPRCAKRTTKLYFKQLEIVCRECGNLTYRRCQIAGDGIAEIDMKLEKLHKRLGIEDVPLWERGLPKEKPKGMHYDTFVKLQIQLLKLRDKRHQAWLSGARAILKNST